MTKGDLGGFENLQGERIYGKRYMRVGRGTITGETPVPLALGLGISPVLPVDCRGGFQTLPYIPRHPSSTIPAYPTKESPGMTS